MQDKSLKHRRIQIDESRLVFNRKLGEFIKSKRESCGLTQTQLAEKIYEGQMEAKGIWKIENGLYTPNMYIVFEIAKAFNQSISEFFDDFTA